MKFLLITILFALLAVSFTSAHYQCGRFACAPGHSCICDNNVFRCVYVCEELTITQTIVQTWVDGANGPSVKVNVEVLNHTHRSIKDIVIATDAKLNAGQIWGARLDGFLMTFTKEYDVTIAPGATYNFGYINKGASAANLWVGAIVIA